MNLFRIRGIQLSVHFSFCLLLPVLALVGWADEQASGALWNVATFLAFFVCVVLHELGHSFTAMRLGVRVRRILLMPIGGMAEFEEIPREPRREILITLAGPAVNFVMAGVLWFYVRLLPDEVPLYSVDGALASLFFANLGMGCFNLLPAFPMDGGRLLRAGLATRLPYVRATLWAATIGKVVAVIMIALALAAKPLGYAPKDFEPYIPVALFAFIIVVGELEYRATRAREKAETDWLLTIERLRAQAASAA